jgi:phosphoenolpyruvate carboxylase
VLTAHPTEVQRKSILDAERAIAELIGVRDHLRSAADRDANERQIRARVTQLWQTRMLRYTKLTVADEIENALSYYQATFLREMPRLYQVVEQALSGTRSAPSSAWATGSAATATATPTSRRHPAAGPVPPAETALRHYLTEVHALGSELSMSQMLAPVTPRCRPWPTARPTTTRTARTSPTAAP